MKKPLPTAVIAVVAVLAVVGLVFAFIKGAGDPEPSAKDVPDYSKMKPEEISAAFQKSKEAEANAMKDVGRTGR